MNFQYPLLLPPPGFITPEEALRRRQITKEQCERIIHGGLSKKQHEQMKAKAIEAMEEYHRSDEYLQLLSDPIENDWLLG